MPRIRSIHPGQWSDDDFIELTPTERLFSIALRNFADDRGVFEWKPTQIKRATNPGDEFGTAPLLKALSVPYSHGPSGGLGKHIQPFKVDGRYFAVIRNFGKWQRVKKPTAVHPMPASLYDYAHVFANGRELDLDKRVRSSEPCSFEEAMSSVQVPNQLPLLEGPIPHRAGTAPLLTGPQFGNPQAEVGGRRLEVGDSSVLRTAADAAKPIDDRTWCFRHGLEWVAKNLSKTEASIRPKMGMWLKACGDNATILRNVLEDAMARNVADVASWMPKAIEYRLKGSNGQATPAEEPLELIDPYTKEGRKDFRFRVIAYKRALEEGATFPWSAKWGGEFPGDHETHVREIVVDILGENFLTDRNR